MDSFGSETKIDALLSLKRSVKRRFCFEAQRNILILNFGLLRIVSRKRLLLELHGILICVWFVLKIVKKMPFYEY